MKDQRKTTRKRADANRPQAKGAARRAFEAYWQGQPNEAGWDDWLAAWRTARGAKPTQRANV